MFAFTAGGCLLRAHILMRIFEQGNCHNGETPESWDICGKQINKSAVTVRGGFDVWSSW